MSDTTQQQKVDAVSGASVPAVGMDEDLTVATVAGELVDGRVEGRAVVTTDGLSVSSIWCSCGSHGPVVYYEKRSVVRGHVSPTRTGHGWACEACRGVVQVG